MADETTPHGETPAVEPGQEPQETDWKAEARKWEARAKENLASAKQNEIAARRLAEIEESQKTEAQKQQDALERAQRELADERSARERAEVAAAKGVPATLLSGATREELEASAAALLEFRGEKAPSGGLLIPSEGNTPPAVGGTTGEQFAAFFKSQMGE